MQLTWDELLDYSDGSNPKKIEGVHYTVMYTQKPDADLGSACSLNDNIWRANSYVTSRPNEGETKKGIALVLRKTYKVNVIAHIDSGPNKGRVVPYESFSIDLSGVEKQQVESSSGSSVMGIICISGCIAFVLVAMIRLREKIGLGGSVGFPGCDCILSQLRNIEAWTTRRSTERQNTAITRE